MKIKKDSGERQQLHHRPSWSMLGGTDGSNVPRAVDPTDLEAQSDAKRYIYVIDIIYINNIYKYIYIYLYKKYIEIFRSL